MDFEKWIHHEDNLQTQRNNVMLVFNSALVVAAQFYNSLLYISVGLFLCFFWYIKGLNAIKWISQLHETFAKFDKNYKSLRLAQGNILKNGKYKSDSLDIFGIVLPILFGLFWLIMGAEKFWVVIK
jgi:hypothetical protein